MSSKPRRRPYGSAYSVVRLRTQARPESSSPTGPLQGGVGNFVKWMAGILAGCLVAVAAFWISQRGEDTLAELRGEPALTTVVRIEDPDSYAVAFGRGPLTRDDLARFRLPSDKGTLFNLVNSYGGARARSMSAQIVLVGGRNKLTVLGIAVRHRTRRAEPLTGGFVIKTTEGGNPSEPITVNLDLQEPFFEVKDRPGVRYFSTETVTLERDERFTFQADFLANKGYHEFDLEVTYLLGGKQEKGIIAGPDQGLFKISGVAEDYRAYGGELYTYVYLRVRGWRRQDDYR